MTSFVSRYGPTVAFAALLLASAAWLLLDRSTGYAIVLAVLWVAYRRGQSGVWRVWRGGKAVTALATMRVGSTLRRRLKI